MTRGGGPCLRAKRRRAWPGARPHRSACPMGRCTDRSGSGNPASWKSWDGSATWARSSRSSPRRPPCAGSRPRRAGRQCRRASGSRRPWGWSPARGPSRRRTTRTAVPVAGVAVDRAVELGGPLRQDAPFGLRHRGEDGVVPLSSTKTPDDRLIFPCRGSARNASARPRIGSGGAGTRRGMEAPRRVSWARSSDREGWTVAPRARAPTVGRPMIAARRAARSVGRPDAFTACSSRDSR